jgi:hypothetical protein
MKPFRELAPVVAEMVSPMPYTALNTAFDPIFPKGVRSYWKGAFVAELTDEAIAAHLEHGPKVPEVSASMHLYPINGACHDIASDDTAFAYRDATFAMVIVAAWQDSGADESRIRWVRDYYNAVAPHSETGGYVNFMGADDQGKVQDNYGANYQRLVAVKQHYEQRGQLTTERALIDDNGDGKGREANSPSATAFNLVIRLRGCVKLSCSSG